MPLDRPSTVRWAAVVVAVGVLAFGGWFVYRVSTCAGMEVQANEPGEPPNEPYCVAGSAWQIGMAASFLVWPPFLLLAAWRRVTSLAWIGFTLYLAESAWLIFSLGGPHFVFGVLPYLLAAMGLSFFGRPANPNAGTPPAAS